MHEHSKRRLSDRIYDAFELACDQEDHEVASALHRALELVLTRRTGPDGIEKRNESERIVMAYQRLISLA